MCPLFRGSVGLYTQVWVCIQVGKSTGGIWKGHYSPLPVQTHPLCSTFHHTLYSYTYSYKSWHILQGKGKASVCVYHYITIMPFGCRYGVTRKALILYFKHSQCLNYPWLCTRPMFWEHSLQTFNFSTSGTHGHARMLDAPMMQSWHHQEQATCTHAPQDCVLLSVDKLAHTHGMSVCYNSLSRHICFKCSPTVPKGCLHTSARFTRHDWNTSNKYPCYNVLYILHTSGGIYIQ